MKRRPSTARVRRPLGLLPFIAGLVLGLVPGLWADAPPQTVTIGNGSGHLRFPDAQATLKLNPGDTLLIRPGTYLGLSLGNLAGSAAAPITVVCDSNTVFSTRDPQPNDFPNIAHLRFENFRFVDYNSTCLRITGQSHDLLFKNFYITNASGWSFHIYDPKKVFNGTKESTFYNFKWEDMVVDGKVNGSAISSSDYQPVSNLKSVLLDFEIHRCTFRRFDNTRQAFPVIGLDKCFNLRVHECTFADIGIARSPIGHNVCIGGAGYFKVYNNKFTRQWANDVRVWPMKLNALGYDGPDAVSRFYNNISWEKRKYPMYEHNQVPQASIDNSSGYLSRTSSEVYFNTLYRSRKAADSKDPYVATLVDVYGPEVTIKHNLIVEPEADAPLDPDRNHVYHLGAGPQRGVVAENNLVFKTLEESGLVGASSFAPGPGSPVRDAATGRIRYITKDHNSRERHVGAAADVGAVESQEGAPRTPATTAGWMKDDGNPVLGGAYGTCFDVSVMKDGDRYRMWFSWRPRKSIAVVESLDGIHWNEPKIVLGPRSETGWEDDINRPVVLKREDGYHAWYTGQAKGRSSIGHATSPDGITWKRASSRPVLSPEQPWEKVAVMCPHVIWDEPAGKFRMWYSGGEQYEPDAIGYASSADGVAWTRHEANPIFKSDPGADWEKHKVTACQVVRQDGWHVMFYIGFRDRNHAQIGIARSRDGIAGWQRHPANPIIRPGQGQWDHDACYKPFAIFDDGTWRLWYNGRRGSAEQIGVALHPGEDLGFEQKPGTNQP